MTEGARAVVRDRDADIVIHRLYYTYCESCGGALNDYSDTMAEARRRLRSHRRWHDRYASDPDSKPDDARTLPARNEPDSSPEH